ncbi:response regulator transcription factor [Peristeroidobacter soli]|jgi:DNA-binding NarL/FixJ family response regulator|uniref:response regulator transcription factor n=1 Tax=Peristeroidobacter soli TaxID=2497877 RepID=UPI00101B7C2D|nr:helix-turn-helix transcriptional regulator [Peristeroidobacter soli]
MDTEICEQADIYEQVREAVRQAVSDTLARIATRDDLNTLLLQLMPTPAAAPRPSTPPSPVRLTAREQEILERITAGDSNKEIARAFDLSLHTVKRHVANILTKLGVSSRVQAATWKYARH